MRLTCGLSVPVAAKILRVTDRTLHNWELGRARVPYAAYKLLRILRGWELPDPAWKGYRLQGDTLWSPEGMGFKASDHRWWSLTCRMAAEFRVLVDLRAQLAKGPKPVLRSLSDAPAASVGPAEPGPSNLGSTLSRYAQEVDFPPREGQPAMTASLSPGGNTTEPEVAFRCLTLPNRPAHTESHLSQLLADQSSQRLVGGVS
jgi:hypothetical protein